MKLQSLEIWTTRLLLFLAFSSFVLSYAGMYAVAADSGYTWLSWLWPLATESAVAIFSLVYLMAHLKQYDNRWLMPLIIGCTGLSVWLNVWHAPTPEPLTRVVVALPPILFFAAFKTFIWQVEQDTRRQAVTASLAEMTDENDRLTRQIDQKRQALETLDSVISTRQIEVKKASIADMQAAREAKMEERRHKVLTLFNQEMTQTEMAESLDVSESTIARDIKALRELGALNGSGVSQ